jgi:hypothetical protein
MAEVENRAEVGRSKLIYYAGRWISLSFRSERVFAEHSHISSDRVVRRPTSGFGGCTRRRGGRQPCRPTRRYHVEDSAEARTRRDVLRELSFTRYPCSM